MNKKADLISALLTRNIPSIRQESVQIRPRSTGMRDARFGIFSRWLIGWTEGITGRRVDRAGFARA